METEQKSHKDRDENDVSTNQETALPNRIQGKGMEQIQPQSLQEGTNTTDTFISDFWFLALWETKFLLF